MAPHRRALAVAVLLLFAGCNGALLDGGDGFDAETPSLSEFDYPDGYDEDGVPNGTVAAETHWDRLAATGGVVNATQTFDGGGTARTVIRIDAERERIYSRQHRGGDTSQETFYWGGTLYRHFDGTVHTDAITYEEANYRAQAGLLRTVGILNFSAARTVVVDGTPAVRYEVTEVDRRIGDIADNVESVSGELVVDEEGTIHQFEYRISIDEGGESRTVAGTYEVESYGETTVENPDWMADSEQADERA
ncbi:DUF7537 family lipoprotein [Halostella pelagica]|uniref:DUF7537 family lipoprotein n=1 Tax=Halostella pelagica TaxID=2583824 RepID=UPI0010804FA0|nr:hypothetical protein [Halostella pelagica]